VRPPSSSLSNYGELDVWKIRTRTGFVNRWRVIRYHFDVVMKRTVLLAALALTLAACATVQHGPVQRIRVDSEPSGAKVRTDLCGPGATKEVRTPGVLWVSRRAERCTLTFTADGYVGKRVVLTRKIAEEFLENAEALDVCAEFDCVDDWGWFAVGGLIAGTGFGVDAITGALYEQQPSDVFVSLPLHEDEMER